MIQKKKFQLSFKDILKEEQKSSLEQIVKLTEKLKSQQTKEEKIKTEQEIKDLIIKPESTEKKVLRISEIVATEIESITLTGYNYQRIQSTESSIEGDLSIIQNNKESTEKQEAIQNVLLNHFKVEQSQSIVLTERIEQKHLNHKYFAYYSVVKETGILIVLNDQYGQAARIKKVKSQEQAETQLALLIAMLENSNKKTMDEVQEFEAFANIYTSKEDLEQLYIKKINEHLKTSISKIDLTKSAKEIWESIQGKTITTPGKKSRKINTIQDFIKLSITVITRGKIGKTSVRDILNAILGLNNEKKILTKCSSINEKNERVKYAREKLKNLVIEEGLGKKARNQYKAYLEIKQEAIEEKIDLTKSAKEIWKSIQRKTITISGQRNKEIETIQNFLKLSFSVIVKGRIGTTPMREIINAMLELEEDKKITSYESDQKGKKNQERVETARAKMKKLVIEGWLGKDTKADYEAYLKKTHDKKIDLRGTAKEIWKQVKGQTIITTGYKDKKINTIQDFLGLSSTTIIHGKIESILVREIINAILGLEGKDKILSYHRKDKGIENKKRVETAKEKLKNLVTERDLGEEAQREMQTLILEKTNSITEKPTNTNGIEFDSMDEYVIGKILEEYVTNKDGANFRLETGTNFQVGVEKNNNSKNPRLDFIISTEFTKDSWESIVIEWHPFRLDLVKSKLELEIKNAENKGKEEELEKKLEKLKTKDPETIKKIKKNYENEREKLAKKLLNNETAIVITFQDQKEIEPLYEFLTTFTITNSKFPNTKEEFTTKFHRIYKQISYIQEKKKQRKGRVIIEEYLETNNIHSIEGLTNKQITTLWNESFTFDVNRNKISQRIRNSVTHTRKTKKENEIDYRRRNLIAFYNCDEYKLKDAELEENINQKIEAKRHEITDLEAILKPEHETAETIETKTIEEQVTVDMQKKELLEPIEVYQEFQLTSY
ncbi:hypothetical protein HOL52_00280 [bacterium]|nr:hypothetical protein [bacterium]